MDADSLTEAEALLDAIDQADPLVLTDLPAPLATLASLCEALWGRLYTLEQAGAEGEALERPLFAMSCLALLAWPDDDYRTKGYTRPMRGRPYDDPLKQRYQVFEARVEAAKHGAAAARQGSLDRVVFPSSFSLELLEGVEAKVLASRDAPIDGPATLAYHPCGEGRADYLVFSEPLDNGARMPSFLEILPAYAETGSRARFDIEGLWGTYENGREAYFAHGHEEGDTHGRELVWGEWVLEKVAKLVARARGVAGS